MSPRATTVGLLFGGLALVTGCSGSSAPTGPDAAAAVTPAAALAQPVPSDADQLAALTGTAGTTVYAARYRLSPGDGPAADVVVTHRADGYRLDITAGSATDSLIGSDTGTVSCRVQDDHAECFQAAGAGHQLPDLFDAGVQHVFTDYLATLATATSQYDIDSIVPTVPAPSAPTSSCFAVSALAGAAKPVVPAGTYCLAADGMPTLVTYGAASLVLQQRLASPAETALDPPASPQPLPSGS